MTMLNRMPPLVLYKLKRDYGGPIDIYKLVSSETNARTGQKVVTTNVVHISRAIIMPAGYSRTKPFSGQQQDTRGLRDVSVRDFIVDRKDARNLDTLTSDDWLVHKGLKYQVKTVEADDVGWVIAAKEIGEVPQQTISVQTDDRVWASDNAS
jgi:hypothetical protein